MLNQFKILASSKSRIFILLAIAVLLSIVVVVIAQKATNRSPLPVSDSTPENKKIIEVIDSSPDFDLRIKQDEDAPMKILSAKVKEISAADYRLLTSNQTELQNIVSVPEISLKNVSDKTISDIMLIIEDKTTQKSRGLLIKEQKILPGTLYKIAPQGYIKEEVVSSVDESGKSVSSTKEVKANPRYWMSFADKNQIEVRIGVTFEDGTKWFNKDQEGGK
jgi:hypothetical protein